MFKEKKVIVYIDGFNLYYGLKKAIRQGYKKQCKWLDIVKFSEAITPDGYKLIQTKYFTSRITSDPDKEARQSVFIDAISTLSKKKIYFGIFQANQKYCEHCNKPMICDHCKENYIQNSEKRTDVNIATEMLLDAFLGKFDAAILVSGDSDLVGPIKAIKKHFKRKKVYAAFPPNRSSKHIKKLVDSYRRIKEPTFLSNLLPDPVIAKNGNVLNCPIEWK